ERFDPGGAPWVSSSAVHTPPLIGGMAEMAALRDAFAAMRGGRAVTLFVEGQSGVGKSSLVKQFTRSLGLAHPDVLVLAGRCYERESVPYKAFDGVVDALSRYMLELGMVNVNVPAAMLGDVRRMHVEMLPATQARELATALIGRLSPARPGDAASEASARSALQAKAEAIAEESGGHPLFIDELVRHALV